MKEKLVFLRIIVLISVFCFTLISCGMYNEIVNDSSNLKQEALIDEKSAAELINVSE